MDRGLVFAIDHYFDGDFNSKANSLGPSGVTTALSVLSALKTAGSVSAAIVAGVCTPGIAGPLYGTSFTTEISIRRSPAATRPTNAPASIGNESIVPSLGVRKKIFPVERGWPSSETVPETGYRGGSGRPVREHPIVNTDRAAHTLAVIA